MISTRTHNIAEDPWRSLYKLAVFAVVILTLYSLATIVIMVTTGGQPATVEACFAMLQENRLAGLLRLDLLTVFAMPLYYVLFLGLYMALRRANLAYAALATMLVFAGLTLFLATPSAFSYLFLSDRYAAASTEAQKAQLLAAGEAIFASDMWHGTGAQLGGMLMQTGAVLISIVMLRGTGFGRVAAYVGILTHGLDLAHILVGFFAPEAGAMLMYVAGPLYLVWFPMIARGLYQLSREAAQIHNPTASLTGYPG